MEDREALAALLNRAKAGDQEALGRLLDLYRETLKARARRHLRGGIGKRADASDVVQQTFLEAHQGFGRFQGEDEREWNAWLQKILRCNIAGVLRDNLQAGKRDLRKERSLAPGNGGDSSSSGNGPDWAVDGNQATPSRCAIQVETLVRVVAAMETLPTDQREAVRLRHLEDFSLEEIAATLGRSTMAAAGLVKRGMQTLREKFAHELDDLGWTAKG